MSHPPYWFFHEYLDEAGRMRVFKNTADTEHEARKNHRRAADFAWVTEHLSPTLSPLFTRSEGRDMPIVPGQRPGETYRTRSEQTDMPDYIRDMLHNYTPPTP